MRILTTINYENHLCFVSSDCNEVQRVNILVEQTMNADVAQVREDVQHIFGEEFRVWQWLPDLAWFVSLDILLLKVPFI